ncbi:hypothetical protein [Modicisalibacter luteus]|uniref:hypothetical protein n=1 Tax=Modicisalibacter luteus TaxID=453962 RepID=UPI003627522D
MLETVAETDSGQVAIIDFMPLARENDSVLDVVRIVEGRKGRVEMHHDAAFRFGYGHIAPWINKHDSGATVVAGPDGIRLETPIPLESRKDTSLLTASFCVQEGERIPFVLTWYRSFCDAPPAVMQNRRSTRPSNGGRSGAAVAKSMTNTASQSSDHFWFSKGLPI